MLGPRALFPRIPAVNSRLLVTPATGRIVTHRPTTDAFVNKIGILKFETFLIEVKLGLKTKPHVNSFNPVTSEQFLARAARRVNRY